MIYDCAVVGAGPAGIAVAVQLKRAGWNVILFERGNIGGLVRNAHCIENCLGFPNGISGAQLARLLARHIRRQRLLLLHRDVRTISRRGSGPFHIRTSQGTVRARKVIIATGTMPREAGIPGERAMSGKRVFYEIADLPPFRSKKRFLVIGGGDAGFDYAVALREAGHEPFVLARTGPRCIAALRRHAVALRIPCVERVTPLRLQRVGSAIELLCKEGRWRADYALIAIGRKPDLPRITVGDRSGLHYTGDVRGGQNRQVHIAAGDALRLALRLIRSVPPPPCSSSDEKSATNS